MSTRRTLLSPILATLVTDTQKLVGTLPLSMLVILEKKPKEIRLMRQEQSKTNLGTNKLILKHHLYIIIQVTYKAYLISLF